MGLLYVFSPCGMAVFVPVDPSGSQTTPSYEPTEIYTYLRSTLQVEVKFRSGFFNPLNVELNPMCCLLALLGAHNFLHVSRIRVKSLTLRRVMSYIYGAPILDVSRSHTTTQHSR